MKRLALGMMIAGFAGAIALLPAMGHGDVSPATGANSPLPIGQPLVREGDFAAQLATALGMETAGNEAEAESRLGETGISPKNGWIADYPVTPDIAGEVESSVHAAADAGKIGLSVESALERFNSVMAQAGLSATASSVGGGSSPYPVSASAPGEVAIDDYYTTEGPPVITYYAPPPDYSYLYGWVPYPFWCYGFWFPGYFILNDFHRTVFVGHRHAFVSNHFRDNGGHSFGRIDPVARFNGRPAITTGSLGRNGVPTSGVSRNFRGVGSTGRTPQLAPTSRFTVPASRWNGTGSVTQRSRGAFNTPSAASGRVVTQQRSTYRNSGAPSMASSTYRGGMASSSGMGRSFSSGTTGSSFHGGGFSGGGRGHR